jgi:AcrR family transcriptional regulator
MTKQAGGEAAGGAAAGETAPAAGAAIAVAGEATGAGAGDGRAVGAADQRRVQILLSALEVIAERGYPDTRIADIAERSGISAGLVIYYFKTREHLLTEAIRHLEDSWYSDAQRRLASLPAALAQLEEIVAMICLPEADPQPYNWRLIWLDLWAHAVRNAEVASVRRKADDRWRELIKSVVMAGQANGEFRGVDSVDFSICLATLLDGLAIQVALSDPVVQPMLAFETAMHFVSGQLGFDWAPSRLDIS